MRVLLGWLLLVGLFGLAGFVQHRFSSDARLERARLIAERRAGSGAFETSGQARLLIGRLSGAEPIERPAPPPGAAQGSNSGPTAGRDGGHPADGSPPADWTPPVYELTVQRGQVLSRICEDFYGSGKAPIPQLVATYNGLEDPDSVRAGQTLQLPPLDVLRASRP